MSRKFFLILVLISMILFVSESGISFGDTVTNSADVQVRSNNLTLSNTASTLAFTSVNLDDYYNNPAAFANLNPATGQFVLNVIDARGNGNGWRLTIQSTDFVKTPAPGTISNNYFSLNIQSSDINTDAGLSGSSYVIVGNHNLSSEQTIVRANIGQGMGSYTVNLSASKYNLDLSSGDVIIPGTYTATITASLYNSP